MSLRIGPFPFLFQQPVGLCSGAAGPATTAPSTSPSRNRVSKIPFAYLDLCWYQRPSVRNCARAHRGIRAHLACTLRDVSRTQQANSSAVPVPESACCKLTLPIRGRVANECQ